MTCVDSPAVPARLERAQELIGEGRVSQSRQPSTYHVSALDNRHVYLVELEGPSPCNCPDSIYRGPLDVCAGLRRGARAWSPGSAICRKQR